MGRQIRPDPLLVAARKVYKGKLETKWETLSRYDFALRFENVHLKAWLTEKLFYWGTTDIRERVPPECFIDMTQFAGYEELREFLKSRDRAAVQRYRDAGRAFLESRAFEPFSKEHFAGIFRDLLEQDAGIRTTV